MRRYRYVNGEQVPLMDIRDARRIICDRDFELNPDPAVEALLSASDEQGGRIYEAARLLDRIVAMHDEARINLPSSLILDIHEWRNP